MTRLSELREAATPPTTSLSFDTALAKWGVAAYRAYANGELIERSELEQVERERDAWERVSRTTMIRWHNESRGAAYGEEVRVALKEAYQACYKEVNGVGDSE